MFSAGAPEREVPALKLIFHMREEPVASATGTLKTKSLEAYTKTLNLKQALNIDYSRITRTTDNAPLGRPATDADLDDIVLRAGRFITLAKQNRDHFKTDGAEKVYQIFHKLAIDKMLTLRNSETSGQGTHFDNQKFAEGLVAEAFALHYLTDLFAGGHIRTPRGFLKETCGLAAESVGGRLASCMHDEDNNLGLNVVARDGTGYPWKAYGDKNWSDPRNENNRIKAVEAAKISLVEAINAYKQGTNPSISAFAALDKIPELGNQRNHPPLYRNTGGNLERRTSKANVQPGTYERVWSCVNQATGFGNCGGFIDDETADILSSGGELPNGLPAPG